MQTSRQNKVASITYRIVASAVLLPMLAACGYKGPLYMPPPPPPEETLTAPPQSPAPAPTADDAAPPETTPVD